MKLFLLLVLFVTSVSAKEILLTDENTVTLQGPVTFDSVGEVMHELKDMSSKGKTSDPIYLVLDTPGGSVSAGLELVEYMNTLRRPVHSVAIFAASMGFIILQHSPIRYVTRYSTIMSHRASGVFEGDIPQQVHSRLKRVIDLVTKVEEHVVARTNGKYTLEQYQELIRDEYWGIGSNAIKDGFADEQVSLKCDASLDGTKEKQVQVFIFTTTVQLPRCPLNSAPVTKKKEDGQNSGQIYDFFNKVRTLEP